MGSSACDGIVSRYKCWDVLGIPRAPTTVLADALALWWWPELTKGFKFEYGWVRGLGSLAFVLGSLAIGPSILGFGIGSIVIGQAILLLMAAGAALGSPRFLPPIAPNRRSVGFSTQVYWIYSDHLASDG